jgi:tripartite-type tricarboxylate transporter receptor subunit TctC
MTTKRDLILATAAFALLAAAPAVAETWPARPITFIVPFPAGGGTDAFARPLAAQLDQQLGQRIIIENRGGAGGTVGASAASKAKPDGYTFFVGAAHHAIAPALYPKLDYSIQTDFIPIAVIAQPPQVIVVHPGKVQAKTVAELVDFARKNPEKLNFASAGNGTTHHLAGELFQISTQTKLTHVPYRGAGPALNDVVAGAVPIMFDNLPSSAGFIRNGQLRAIGVTTKERVASFPDVPTIAEGGLTGYETYTWNALFGPANMPRPIVERINQAANQALKDEAVKKKLNDVSADIVGSTPEQLGEHVKTELAKWAPIAKASGAVVE